MSSKHMPTRRGGAAQGIVVVQFEKKQHSKSVLLLPCLRSCTVQYHVYPFAWAWH